MLNNHFPAEVVCNLHYFPSNRRHSDRPHCVTLSGTMLDTNKASSLALQYEMGTGTSRWSPFVYNDIPYDCQMSLIYGDPIVPASSMSKH